MTAKIGETLYWLGKVAALLLAGYAIFLTLNSPRGAEWMRVALAAGAAISAWVVGRAALYLLAAR